MLTKENNEYGVITLNDALITQILAEAIKPYGSRAKYAGERQIRFSEYGLYVYAGVSIRIGSSIRETAQGILDFIVSAVSDQLELPIDNIIIEVVQMTTSKSTVDRSITFSSRGGEDGQKD